MYNLQINNTIVLICKKMLVTDSVMLPLASAVSYYNPCYSSNDW